MAYYIVNAFLDGVTFDSTEAEILIKQVILNTGDDISDNILADIEEVFEPIFYYFPNGLKDKTWWRPRDVSAYIKNWREIAAWRERVETAAPTMQLRRWAPKKLPKDQVQSILREYIKDFIDNVASPQQKKDSWTKNKSRAEARLNFRCGSSMMAKVIWLVGFPNIAEAGFAIVPSKEQRPLEQDVRESIATATETILTWLTVLAQTIQEHKATQAYQEHARKSGTEKNKSELSESELLLQREKKRLARLKYASGSNTWQAPAHWQWHAHTWEAPAQWQWHDDTWQLVLQWQWQPHGY